MPTCRLSLRPTTLHFKGICTLFLFVFAERIAFCNAIKLWSLKGQKKDGFSQQTECHPNTPFTRDGSCPAPPSTTYTRLLQRNPLSKRAATAKKFVEDCCEECYNCMDPDIAAKTCNLPRGGHLDHAASSTMSTPYAIPLNVWKIIFQAFLTAINVLCWLIPLKSKRITDNKLALSLANAFSGGVFLSLAFGHLIPECIHGFDSSWPETMPYLLVLGGYLIIFFFEKVAFDAHEIMHEMSGDDDDHHHHHHDKPNGTTTTISSGRSAVILLGALAVHSVLEMMALGLADSFSDCALLSLSISLHQPAESIALLVAFLKSGMPEEQIIKYLSVFSCFGPIGVALGISVNEFAAPIVDAIMLAIVAGTFVYVGATEVIPEEWEDSSHKWKKFAALMSGIVSIYAITQYTMQFHDH